MKINKKDFYQGKSKLQLRGSYIAASLGIVGILIILVLMLFSNL